MTDNDCVLAIVIIVHRVERGTLEIEMHAKRGPLQIPEIAERVEAFTDALVGDVKARVQQFLPEVPVPRH